MGAFLIRNYIGASGKVLSGVVVNDGLGICWWFSDERGLEPVILVACFHIHDKLCCRAGIVEYFLLLTMMLEDGLCGLKVRLCPVFIRCVSLVHYGVGVHCTVGRRLRLASAYVGGREQRG